MASISGGNCSELFTTSLRLAGTGPELISATSRPNLVRENQRGKYGTMAGCTGLQQALVSERFVRNWSEYYAPTSRLDCLEKEKRYDVDRKDSS